jgi:hypothetical protein
MYDEILKEEKEKKHAVERTNNLAG